jgi:hypothetical protein
MGNARQSERSAQAGSRADLRLLKVQKGLGDATAVKSIAVDARMFAEDEVGFFDEMLAGFADGSMVEHEWLVVEDERGDVVAAAYFAPRTVRRSLTS